MEKRDLELIERYSKGDHVLANLYKEHLDYEKKVDDLEAKTFLTAEEEFELKAVKKRKLMGRDQMESILRKYRAAEKSN